MNCTTLNTAAEILEAFRACNNPEDEIELFECLATRQDPPVEAFVELLRSIKLEPVLALTIQTFGKITDAGIKARLKQSDDLLTMLSQQAQSGSSDLIRWAAATTIESVGFDFIAISQHLVEEPRKIAEKIVQPKIERFTDKQLLNSNDYSDFVRFWSYGSSDNEFIKVIKQGQPTLATAIHTFCEDFNSRSVNHPYRRLQELIDQIEILSRNINKKNSAQDCNKWHSQLLQEMQYRKAKIHNLRKNLHHIKSINSQLYEKVFSQLNFDTLLDVNEEILRNGLNNLRSEVTTFYNFQLNPINSCLVSPRAEITRLNQTLSKCNSETAEWLKFILLIAMCVFLWSNLGWMALIVSGIAVYGSYTFLVTSLKSDIKKNQAEYDKLYSDLQKLENQQSMVFNLMSI